MNEVSMQFDPGHRRHVHVSDQADRFGDTRGCEEIGRRWKDLDSVAQRPHEPSHGLAKERVVIDDRDQ
jgi:hypothetical protein